MIAIIGPIPTVKNEKDGMLQRIKVIDKLFADMERIYVSNVVNEAKFILKEVRRVIVGTKTTLNKSENVNFYKYISKNKAETILSTAKYIYVHSIYSASKIPMELLEKYVDKIILDIHGCAIEEMEYYGEYNREEFEKFKYIEQLIFKRAKKLICVTEEMMALYMDKYNIPAEKFIVLPIFGEFDNKLDRLEIEQATKETIIYAGTYLKWQNVDKMIELIAHTVDNFHYIICTKDVKKFKQALDMKNVKNIPVYSVNPKRMATEYIKAAFGLLLREDIIINRVACPTKAIEYLGYGIIPIVLQPNIGDFNKLGYSYVTYEDVFNGKLPSQLEQREMIENNYLVLDKLNEKKQYGEKKLVDIIKSK